MIFNLHRHHGRDLQAVLSTSPSPARRSPRATATANRAAATAAPMNLSRCGSRKPSSSKGEENVAVFHKTETSYRKYRKLCGGHLMTFHPPFGLIDVYTAAIPTYRHQPGCTSTIGDRAAHQSRAAQDEGHAEGNGRIGGNAAGIAARVAPRLLSGELGSDAAPSCGLTASRSPGGRSPRRTRSGRTQACRR